MWALAGLTTIHPDNIETSLGMGGLWSLLLFRVDDEAMRSRLQHDWSLVSSALGYYAHIITLVNRDERTGAVSLPRGYESAIGQYCNQFGVPVDQLPCLVILNGWSDSHLGIPYLPLNETVAKMGPKALLTVVGDLQRATLTSPPDDEAAKKEWLGRATNLLLRTATGRQIRWFITDNSQVILAAARLVKKLVKSQALPAP